MKRSLLSFSLQPMMKVSGLSVLLSASLVSSSIGFFAHPSLAVEPMVEPIDTELEAEAIALPISNQQLANPLGGPLGVCTLREKLVKAGDWRTLETYWNATGHAFFQSPKGAEIKVRYGAGSIFGKDRQKQKLDGENTKKLEVGAFSVLYARMQMKVPQTTTVRYFACSGGVANDLPKIKF
jgi:hypothetical protein